MKNSLLLIAKNLVKKGDLFINKFGEKDFHKEAVQLLSSAKIYESFNYKELALNAFEKSFNHEQNFKHLEFSDLPLTIARGEKCFVDLYFWRRRPTVIHNHHFRGAFQCLEGLNIDSEFKFTKLKQFTRSHSLGKLEEKRVKTLKQGEIEGINFQDKFIHQNLHQSDLTVNLCFRTADVPKKNLSNFLYSGFKYEKEQSSLSRVERLLAFTRINDFDYKKLNLNLEDAINFELMTYGSESKNPFFLKLKKYLAQKVKDETGLNISSLINQHEKILDKIESEYE